MNRYVFQWSLWVQVGPLALRTQDWKWGANFIVNRPPKYSFTAWWLRIWFVAISWRW